jgi:WD40 repeat protein
MRAFVPLLCVLLTSAWAVGADEKAAPRLDRHGDPLPEGASQRLGTARFRLASPDAVAWSADGKLLAAVSAQGGALWEANSGKMVCRLPRGATLAVSPDGRTIAVQFGGTLLVEARTGAQKAALPEAQAPFAFSPDGKRFAAWHRDRRVVVYDSASVKVVTSTEKIEAVEALAFTPDGGRLHVFHGGRMLRCYDLAEQRRLSVTVLGEGAGQLFWGETDPLFPPALAATPRFVACSGSCRVDLTTGPGVGHRTTVWAWDLGAGKELGRWPGTKRRVGPREETELPGLAVAVSADGRSLAWSDAGGGLTLADVRSGVTRRVDRGPLPLPGLAFSPDGKTLAAVCLGGDMVRLWDVATGAEKTAADGHCGAVSALAVAPDGRLVASGGLDGTVRLWDRHTGAQLRALTGHEGGVCDVRFTPDGRLLSLSLDGTARTWDVKTGREVEGLRLALSGPEGLLLRAWSSPDGRWVAAAWAEKVRPGDRGERLELRLWERETGKLFAVRRTVGLPLDVSRAVFVSDEGTVALGQPFGDGVKLLDLTSAQEADAAPVGPAWALPGLQGARQVAFSGDRRFAAYVTLSDDERTSNLRLVEMETQQVVWSGTAPGPTHARTVPAPVLTPDGRALVTGGDLTSAYVWGLEPPSWRRQRPARPAAADLERAWEALAGEDAVKAYEAGWLLSGGGAATALLAERLRPVPTPSAERLRRLLDDLDSDDFGKREAATRELRALDGAAAPAMRAALRAHPSLETARRLEEILTAVRRRATTREELRDQRAVTALARAGTPEARDLLARLAAGAPGARLTEAAKASLRCLGGPVK